MFTGVNSLGRYLGISSAEAETEFREPSTGPVPEPIGYLGWTNR